MSCCSHLSTHLRAATPMLLAGWLAACGSPEAPPGPAAPADQRLAVYAVNYPLAYFARRIGEDAVRVGFPVPAGTDPDRWQPTPEQLAPFRQADLVLLNGAGYADWINAAGVPNHLLVDTTRSFRDRIIRTPSGAMATYTWLDPDLAVEQARAVLDALLTYRPELESVFRSHFTLLERDLEALDEELQVAFAPLNGQPILFARPVYQYLERRFAPAARSLDWDPERVPDAAALAALRGLLADFPAHLLIWDREPYAVTVKLLEAEGLRSIAFATGANAPADGDYLDLMHWNLGNLARAAPAVPSLPSAPIESD